MSETNLVASISPAVLLLPSFGLVVPVVGECPVSARAGDPRRRGRRSRTLEALQRLEDRDWLESLSREAGE